MSRSRSRTGHRDRRLGAALLGLALAVAGAFLVSMVADILGPGDAPGDAAAHLDPGREPFTVRVEVLNGSGTPGLARRATEALRDAGFDVVYFGNAPSFGHDSTAVLARSGGPAAARAVARALGVQGVRVEPDSTLVLDVTVILGTDWPPRDDRGRSLLDRLRAILP